MIEFIALIVLILFAVFLIVTFTSYASFILNLIILIAFYFLIRRDLRNRDNHKFYLISLFLTAVFFILSTTGFIQTLISLTQKILLSLVVVAVILVFVFANLAVFVHKGYLKLREKYKKWK